MQHAIQKPESSHICSLILSPNCSSIPKGDVLLWQGSVIVGGDALHQG